MGTQIELATLIPSQDVRKYIMNIGWNFSDRETATLLINGYSCSRPIEKMFSGLRILYNETSEQEIRAQIGEYLDRIGCAYQDFQKNEEKNFIYILKMQDIENKETYYPRIHPNGYFFDFEMACEYGRKEKVPFQISKHLVGAPGLLEQYEDGEYCNYETDYLLFNREGIAYFFSSQLSDASNDTMEECFVNAFVEIPNPFDRGDIVRFVGEEEYGIVETSQKCWKEDVERHRKNGWKMKLTIGGDNGLCEIPLEFGDDRIRVAFLNDDGTFSHRHIHLIDLERYQLKINESHGKDDLRDKLLLTASDLYRGEGSLDELYFNTMQYRGYKNRGT